MVLAATINVCVESSPPETPDHKFFDASGRHAFHQTMNLNIVNLITAIITCRGFPGHIGKPGYLPHERYNIFGNLEFKGNSAHGRKVFTMIGHRILEACGAHAFLQQSLQINIRENNLFFVLKTRSVSASRTLFS